MKRPAPAKVKFDLTARCLCLDFANTVDKRSSAQPEDKLSEFEALVAFGQQTGIFSPGEARELRERGKTHPEEAARVFRQAVELRELVFRILSAVVCGGEVPKGDAKALNGALQELNASMVIAPVRGQLAWRTVEKNGSAGRLIGRIVRSAVELLTSEDIERVRKCAADTCWWLFLDRSRSHNRRWCEMRTCGSRQKAKAYYRRKTTSQRPD